MEQANVCKLPNYTEHSMFWRKQMHDHAEVLSLRIFLKALSSSYEREVADADEHRHTDISERLKKPVILLDSSLQVQKLNGCSPAVFFFS